MSYNTEIQVSNEYYNNCDLNSQLSNKQLDTNNVGISNINNSFHERIIKKFDKMDISEMKPAIQNINETIFEEDLSIIIDELVNLYFKEINKGKEENAGKQYIFDYINNYKINTQEIYNWLLINQNDSNSIYLFGYFNYYGIGTNVNKQKAIELYQKATKLENRIAQYELAYIYVLEEDFENYGKAFKLYQKAADLGNSQAMNDLGYCYDNGIGTNVNKQKAFELYQKAADLGNSCAIYNLGYCYEEGTGTDINKNKAFELYQKAVDLGNSFGMYNLGYCYHYGIGTDVNMQKALELYQKASKLENYYAQYSLALMYEQGNGIKKDINQAIYWYKKSAEKGYQIAQDRLKNLMICNKFQF